MHLFADLDARGAPGAGLRGAGLRGAGLRGARRGAATRWGAEHWGAEHWDEEHWGVVRSKRVLPNDLAPGCNEGETHGSTDQSIKQPMDQRIMESHGTYGTV